MSLGKLPVIKGLVSTSQSRRRFKSDLSVDMISPPLGDFRHTMHIGRGGDVFGDTSFLSSYGGPAHDEEPHSPSGSRPTRFLSRTLRHVRRNPPARLRGGSRDLSSPPPSVSPIIKTAISLPQLNLDASNGGLKRALLSTSISSPADSRFSYSLLDSGFVTLPRMDQNFREASGSLCSDYRRSSLPENSDMTLTRSDSLTSFTVDLGPSLMTEVLGLIDSSRRLFSSTKDWDMEESSSVSPQDDDDDEEQLNVCPVREEVRIEPQRFQEAADVLVHHFGGGGGGGGGEGGGGGGGGEGGGGGGEGGGGGGRGGGLVKEERHRSSSFRHKRALYTFTETEEEINV